MKGLRWLVVSLVALATIINYIDRNALAVMWPEMSGELGLDKNDYALILTFFMVGYAVGQSLFGKIFDAVGTRLGFVLAIVVWSVFVALHAVVRTASAFGAVRFVMAVGEAGNWPGATKSNAEWFPVRERALAQGIFNAGASIGAVVSAPVVALLYLAVGWQATFFLLGGVGFLWLIPWLVVYKSGPESHPWLSADEREHILTGQRVAKADAEDAESAGEINVFAPGWREMLRYRQSWSVIASRFFLDPVWWMFISWLPIYLAEQFGFDVKQIGLTAWVPYVGAAFGGVFGGWLAGRLLVRGWSVDRTSQVCHRRRVRTHVPGAASHRARLRAACGRALDGGDPVRLPDGHGQHPNAAERLLFGPICGVTGRCRGHRGGGGRANHHLDRAGDHPNVLRAVFRSRRVSGSLRLAQRVVAG